MKRIIALTLAILMVAAVFCACGEKTKSDTAKDGDQTATEAAKDVTTTVDSKYDQGYAEKYAKSVTTDDNGNKVYEFDAESYNNYTRDYGNELSKKIEKQVSENHPNTKGKTYGQYCYINGDKQAVIVGVNPGQYNEADAKKEASSLAESAFPYFKGIENPVETVKVIYCNANDQNEIYGTFEYTIK